MITSLAILQPLELKHIFQLQMLDGRTAVTLVAIVNNHREGERKKKKKKLAHERKDALCIGQEPSSLSNMSEECCKKSIIRPQS